MLNLLSVSTRLKARYALSLTVALTCFPSFFKWVHNSRLRTNQAIRNIHRMSEDHTKIMQYLVAASLQATLGFVSRLGLIARRLGLPHFKTSPARFCCAAVTLPSAFFEPTAQISIQLARHVGLSCSGDATHGVRCTADVTVNFSLNSLPACGHHEW
jgi:hypothetical protein